MKTLLVAEYRQGKLQESYTELLAFAGAIGAESAMFLVADSSGDLPRFAGTLYLAEAAGCGEYNPDVHKQLLQEAIRRENPDLVVFSHSSYGWDLAPRIAVQQQAAQVSEVIGIEAGTFVVPSCNGKLRRTLAGSGPLTVVTIQAGAFTLAAPAAGVPNLVELSADTAGRVQLLDYEAAKAGGVDLTRAEVIVSAGRGVGKPENIAMVEGLAKALKGEYGASRPVVDAEWVSHERQVGTTGMTVSPKLYVACGISGAVQHLAGMKKSEFVVAINTDREAPIGEVADVFAVADLKQLLPVLTERILAL